MFFRPLSPALMIQFEVCIKLSLQEEEDFENQKIKVNIKDTDYLEKKRTRKRILDRRLHDDVDLTLIEWLKTNNSLDQLTVNHGKIPYTPFVHQMYPAVMLFRRSEICRRIMDVKLGYRGDTLYCHMSIGGAAFCPSERIIEPK
ncbi:hypothetical protein AVEN_159505-1 [Araneus ventricosus]|uniref:Uncharacterized protein n=1 Tax=Araneus ventricosus TaxID=182803 RepID=A0A4Y2A1A0_ARAVE|nr:hypothetical protein AVEN_159505-1 [Araneus ventricosus]